MAASSAEVPEQHQQIVCKFKTIRDLAPHEHPGHVDAASLPVEEAEDLREDVCSILELAEEIRTELPPGRGDIPEDGELPTANLDGVLTAFGVVHACARDAASPSAYNDWPWAAARIIRTMQRAEKQIESIIALKSSSDAPVASVK